LNSRLPKYLLIVPAFLISLVVVARSNVTPGGGRPAGMGNAFVSQSDINSALHNQAGLSSISHVSFSAFFENRFLLNELSLRGIIVGIPTKSGFFATTAQAFGPAKWMETTLCVAYAKQLTPKLSGGIQLSYFGMKLPEDDQTLSSAGAELGFIYQLSPTLFAGVHLANPFSIPFQTSSYIEKIPWRIRLGGHARVANEIIIAFEAEKTEKLPFLVKAGLEWEVAKQLYLRGGYNSGTTNLFSGIGFSYRSITADLAFGYHQVLGITPSVSINFILK
jgi:hypothetical protein